MVERGVTTQYLVAVGAASVPGVEDGFAESTFCDFFGNQFCFVDLMIHSDSKNATTFVIPEMAIINSVPAAVDALAAGIKSFV